MRRLIPHIALTTAALAMPAMGAIWTEPTDSGSLIPTAQVPGPINQPLGTISGSLGFSANPIFPLAIAAIDYEDVFTIFIDDPALFSASMFLANTDFDAQLWLFDSNGLGILGNDQEFSAPGGDAALTNIANDGTGSAVTTAGIYYLAISGLGNTPLSGGLNIFGPTPLAPGELSGPDGPGGSTPLTGWSGIGEVGFYSIELTGVRTVPTPAAPLILAASAIFTRRRR